MFSSQLKAWRNVDDANDGRGDFTQEEAAARLGVPLRTYQDWEQGRRRPQGLAYNVVSAKINLLDAKGAGRRIAPSNRKTIRARPARRASKSKVTNEKKKTRRQRSESRGQK